MGESVFDSSIPPGSGAPYHLHTDADEIIFVVSGMINITLNGEDRIAREGDTIFIPKHTSHGFKNVGLYAARLLFTSIRVVLNDFFGGRNKG
ncbi:cupin domain-containing protein [Aeromonas hydrophila]|uniref:Cupin domain-containing protein n=1 Tax=Aeromonas hydrophila TaxID=644 RepID=A0A926FJV2_AERHY|nr:cupin domain-containing protein [Aeromonas hydrophila]